MNSRLDINIAVIGPVSVGKSTFINTLFIEQYSDVALKRTTMVPQIYMEENKNNAYIGQKNIRHMNRITNIKFGSKSICQDICSDDIDEKTENEFDTQNEDYEIKYSVPIISNLITRPEDIYLTIYDIPGINDQELMNKYMAYLDSNLYKFDLIIFILDINNAMNTNDQQQLLNKVASIIKTNKDKTINTDMIILLNKCDDMRESKNGELELDAEYIEMKEQAMTEFKKILYPQKINYTVVCVSLEDAYIYRMIKKNKGSELDEKHKNKLGCNEFGKSKWNRMKDNQREFEFTKLIQNIDHTSVMKLSGFTDFKHVLNQYLSIPDQYNYLCNHIRRHLQKLLNNLIGIPLNKNQYIEANKYLEDDMIHYNNLLNNIIKLRILYKNNDDMLEKEYNESLNKYMEIFREKMEYKKYINIQNYTILPHEVNYFELFVASIKKITKLIKEKAKILSYGLVEIETIIYKYYLNGFKCTTLSIENAKCYFNKIADSPNEIYLLAIFNYIVYNDTFTRFDINEINIALETINYSNLKNPIKIKILFIILSRMYQNINDFKLLFDIYEYWKNKSHYMKDDLISINKYVYYLKLQVQQLIYTRRDSCKEYIFNRSFYTKLVANELNDEEYKCILEDKFLSLMD